MPTDAYVDTLLRSLLFQAKTAKSLEEFNIHLEGVAGQENVAIVKEQLAKIESKGS